MNAIESTFPKTFVGRARSWAERWTIDGAVWLLLFLGILNFPSLPNAGLDPSWRQVLGFVWRESLQFGPEIVFTYGPLGFLLAPTNTGADFSLLIGSQLLLSAACAAMAIAISRNYRGLARGFTLGFFLLLLGPSPEAEMMLMMIAATLVYSRRVKPGAWWWALALAVFLALGSLQKFTQFIFAVGAITLLILQAAQRRDWRAALILPSSYLGALVIGWVAFDQSLRNLLLYVVSSLELSAGYNRTMALPADTTTLMLGLAAFGGVVSFGWGAWKSRQECPPLVWVGLVALLASFLQWKHGFVRADAHTAVHFVFQLFLAILLPVLAPQGFRQRATARAIRAAVIVICIWGAYRAMPDAVVNSVTDANNRVVNNGVALLGLDAQHELLSGYYTHVSAQSDLAQIRQRIGEERVDVLGYEQAYAIFNRFNYAPRPVFQSYMATTEALSERNAVYLRSENSPRFLLQRIQTIDNRLPALEDAPATLELLQSYRLVDYATRFLVWERRAEGRLGLAKTLVNEMDVSWGDEVLVPDTDGDPVWCEIELTPSWSGRLRTLLYHGADLGITATEQTGFTMSFRYLPTAGESGFLVSPHLVSTPDMATYMSGGGEFPRLRSFSLFVRSGSPSDFPVPFRVRLYRLSGLVRDATIPLANNNELFRSFSHAPVRQEALYPMAVVQENGQEVLGAHPPSQMDFRVPAGTRAIRVGFGYLEATLPHVDHTNGVDFSIVALDSKGNQVAVFSRRLDPAINPAHREPQQERLELPTSAVLVQLQTGPGPANDISFDWVYWRDLVFETAAPAPSVP